MNNKRKLALARTRLKMALLERDLVAAEARLAVFAEGPAVSRVATAAPAGEPARPPVEPVKAVEPATGIQPGEAAPPATMGEGGGGDETGRQELLWQLQTLGAKPDALAGCDDGALRALLDALLSRGLPDDDDDIEAVARHHEKFSEDYRRAGLSKGRLVAGYVAERKGRSGLSAAEYLGVAARDLPATHAEVEEFVEHFSECFSSHAAPRTRIRTRPRSRRGRSGSKFDELATPGKEEEEPSPTGPATRKQPTVEKETPSPVVTADKDPAPAAPTAGQDSASRQPEVDQSSLADPDAEKEPAVPGEVPEGEHGLAGTPTAQKTAEDAGASLPARDDVRQALLDAGATQGQLDDVRQEARDAPAEEKRGILSRFWRALTGADRREASTTGEGRQEARKSEKARKDGTRDFGHPAESQAVQDYVSGVARPDLPDPNSYAVGKKTRDPLLESIIAESGRGEVPALMPLDRLQALKDKGWIISYRAVGEVSSADRVRKGAYYAGPGFYGSGMYSMGERAGGLAGSLGMGYGYSRDDAIAQARDYAPHVVAIAIPPTARIVTMDRLKAERGKYLTGLARQLESGQMSRQEYDRHLEVVEDFGRFAALANYDVIKGSANGHYNILNRSICRMSETNV